MKKRVQTIFAAFIATICFSSCDTASFPYYLTQNKINVALVIDVSGSMSGTSINNARLAAVEIVEMLTKEDTLSVVLFNNSATVLIPAGKVSDAVSIRETIMGIQSSGGTEASAGLVSGYAEIRKNSDEYEANACILICDGDISSNAPALAAAALETGIRTSGVAIGSGVNSIALKNVAESGDGSVYAVSNSEDIQNAFIAAVQSFLFPVDISK